jgi:ATP-binding cassette subfamily F protein 3
VLSGGERTRLALAKLLVTPVNFLCLDEPTNHLDVISRDVLEDALVEYGSTIVLITHDRHLIRSIANRIVAVTAGVTRSFLGGYDDYLYRKAREEDGEFSIETRPGKSRPRGDKAEARRRRAALRRIEAELDAAVAERDRVEKLMAEPTLHASSAKADEMMREHKAAVHRISELETEWERLTEALEGAG